MLLKSIYLKNIRSYKEEKIEFKKGTNLLWGEVGSGKTTVLLAIEFALFGLGKDEGKLLLRNGEKEGEVILTLIDSKENKNFKIKRTLEKEKTGQVRQKRIIIENNEDILELTPSEANNYILKKFNLPKTKGQKNLAYRYIIYTPQEELKKILEEREDKRKSIIRKAFGIERYKNLKEVLSNIYLNEKRLEKKIYEEKIKELDNIIEELKKSKEELKKEEEKFLNKKEKLENLKKKREELEKKEELLEKNKKIIEKKKEELEKIINTVENIEKNIEEKKNKIAEIEKNIKELLKENPKKELLKKFQQLKEKIKDKKKQIEEFKKLEQNKEIYEKRAEEIKSLNNKLEGENNILKERIKEIDEKSLKKKLEELNNERNNIEKLKERNKILDKEIIDYKSERDRIIKEIEEKKKNIQDFKIMKVCNTCFQKVPDSHKQNVISKLKEKIENLEEDLEKYSKKVKEFEDEKRENTKIIEKRSEIEIEISKINEKLKDFYKTTKIIQTNLKKIDENDNLLKELKKSFDIEKYNFLKEKYIKYNEEIQIFNKYQNKVEKLEIFEKELNRLKKEIEDKKEKIKDKKDFEIKLEEIKKKEKKIEINFEKLKIARKKINEKIEVLSKERGVIESNLKNLTKKIEELEKKAKEGEKTKEKYKQILELENWIQNDLFLFLNEMEKYLFKKYLVDFNEEFEKIFRELIEDGNISVYLDSDFSPNIEINGYIEDFNTLSGGERSSVALAYRIALSQVIENNLLEKIKLKFIILDEPTDGFSSKQVSKISYLLQKFNFEQTIIVSHDEKLKATVDNIINLEKKNGISKVTVN